MTVAKKEKKVMPDREIVGLFLDGLSLDMLSTRISNFEECGKRKAKDRAVNVIYDYQMAESRKIWESRA